MGRPKGSKNIPDKTKFAIIELWKADIAHVAISNQFSIPRSTISNIIHKYKQRETSENETRRRKLILNPRCKRRLLRMIDENKFKPLHVTASKFRTAKGERISIRTIGRHVHRAYIGNYNAVSKPYLTRNHINSRLHWAITRRNWIHMDWNNVVFSDESSYIVRQIHLRKRFWRIGGTRFKRSNLISKFKSG